MKSKLSSKILACSLSSIFSHQNNGYLFDNNLFLDNASDSKQKRLAQKRKNKRK